MYMFVQYIVVHSSTSKQVTFAEIDVTNRINKSISSAAKHKWNKVAVVKVFHSKTWFIYISPEQHEQAAKIQNNFLGNVLMVGQKAQWKKMRKIHVAQFNMGFVNMDIFILLTSFSVYFHFHIFLFFFLLHLYLIRTKNFYMIWHIVEKGIHTQWHHPSKTNCILKTVVCEQMRDTISNISK